MMEYKLTNGEVLTDEDLEREAEQYEKGTWEGGLVNLRLGRPTLSNEELGYVTFKAPKSRIAAMEQAARERGMSKSQFMRAAMESAITA